MNQTQINKKITSKIQNINQMTKQIIKHRDYNFILKPIEMHLHSIMHLHSFYIALYYIFIYPPFLVNTALAIIYKSYYEF